MNIDDARLRQLGSHSDDECRILSFVFTTTPRNKEPPGSAEHDRSSYAC
jgi:hypothetical protein